MHNLLIVRGGIAEAERQQQDASGGHLLPEGLHAGNAQTVLQHADIQDTNDCADHATGAPGKAGPTAPVTG